MCDAAETTATGPGPGPPAASLPLVVAMCLFGIVFGAVSGLHVFALMSGHGQFVITKEIEQFLVGQSMWTAPVPTDRMALWETFRQLPVLGGALWLRCLTWALALACAGGILAIINPRLVLRLRTGDIAWWRPSVALIATAGLLYGALYKLPAPVMQTTFPFTRAALAGGLAWLLWHRRGWLHTNDRPPSLWVIIGQLSCGAVVGLTAHAFMRHDLTFDDMELLDDWLSAGYYDPGMWRQLGLYSIGLHAWGGLLAATAACFLGQPGTSLRARLRSILPALLLLCLTTAAARIYLDRVWFQQYQFGVSLPDVLGLSGEFRPQRRVVLLIDQEGEPVPFRVSIGQSWVGLPTTDEVNELVRHNLLAHHGRLCAAKQLWFALHDTATWNWDSSEALNVAREQVLSPSSTPVFGAEIFEALHRLPNSAEAGKMVDALLSDAWSLPMDDAKRELLDVAWRYGRLDEAVKKVAGSQAKQVAELRKQTPPRGDNTLSGKLLLSGQPFADARVGLVRAEKDDWAVFFRDPRMPLTAWEQRLVIASVDVAEDGRFAFDHLFDGGYRLVVRIRGRDLPRDGGLIAQGFGGRITVKGGQSKALPLLNLIKWEPPEQAAEVSGPGTPRASRAL